MNQNSEHKESYEMSFQRNEENFLTVFFNGLKE